MRRRTVLAAGLAAAVGTAGCAGDPRDADGTTGGSNGTAGGDTTTTGTTPAGSLPSVRVTETWHGGLSPVGASTVTVERGSVVRRIECRNGRTVERRQDLEPAAYRSIQRLVAGLDLDAWRREYPCEDPCPTDDGVYDYTVERDGRTVTTTVDPAADVPAGLDRLDTALEPYRERFEIDGFDVCTGTTTPE